ncbi:MAG: hypothetical protein ACRD0D_10385 [Acidimicrobiales bacterium]
MNRRITPRRTRCKPCNVTHVLLPPGLAARRADEVAVIAHAVELNAINGLGHRKVAQMLDRPETTVRDWMRTFQANAPAITAAFGARVHRATAEALGFWPAPAATRKANAWAMLMAHARVLAHVHRPGPGAVVTVTWHQGALAAHGPWFFSKVGWPEPVQHLPALPPGG